MAKPVWHNNLYNSMCSKNDELFYSLRRAFITYRLMLLRYLVNFKSCILACNISTFERKTIIDSYDYLLDLREVAFAYISAS